MTAAQFDETLILIAGSELKAMAELALTAKSENVRAFGHMIAIRIGKLLDRDTEPRIESARELLKFIEDTARL